MRSAREQSRSFVGEAIQLGGLHGFTHGAGSPPGNGFSDCPFALAIQARSSDTILSPPGGSSGCVACRIRSNSWNVDSAGVFIPAASCARARVNRAKNAWRSSSAMCAVRPTALTACSMAAPGSPPRSRSDSASPVRWYASHLPSAPARSPSSIPRSYALRAFFAHPLVHSTTATRHRRRRDRARFLDGDFWRS